MHPPQEISPIEGFFSPDEASTLDFNRPLALDDDSANLVVIDPIQQLVKAIMKTGGLDNKPALRDYLKVMQDHVKLDYTSGDIIRDVTIASTSYVIGTAGALGFRSTAAKAARHNAVLKGFNIAGAVGINAILNGYYGDFVISPIVEGTQKHLHLKNNSDLRSAYYRLQGLDPSTKAAVLRALKLAGVNALLVVPAVVSAYPYYILAKEDPQPIPVSVLISLSMLQIKGCEVLFINLIGSQILSPIYTQLQIRCSPTKKQHAITQSLRILKQAHINVIKRSQEEFLRYVQEGNDDAPELQKIYDLFKKLNQPNTTESDKLDFLLSICKFAPKTSFQASTTGQTILQSLTVLMTLCAQPGYYLGTVADITDTLKNPQYQWLFGTLGLSAAADWGISSAVYSISLALTTKVAWDVSGGLYNVGARAADGVSRLFRGSWNQPTWSGFASDVWQKSTTSFKSTDFIRLPLSISQSRKVMIPTLMGLWGLVYASTSTSTYLNEKNIINLVNETTFHASPFPHNDVDPVKRGQLISNALLAPTIITTMFFNGQPLDQALGRLQRFIKRLWGSQKEKNQHWLNDFFDAWRLSAEEFEEQYFINILKDFQAHGLTATQLEETYQFILGVKNPAELFPNANYKTLTDMIDQLESLTLNPKASDNALPTDEEGAELKPRKSNSKFFEVPTEKAPLLNKSGTQKSYTSSKSSPG